MERKRGRIERKKRRYRLTENPLVCKCGKIQERCRHISVSPSLWLIQLRKEADHSMEKRYQPAGAPELKTEKSLYLCPKRAFAKAAL